MDPLKKCLQTLDILVRSGDVNGIPLAEKAIDEFLNAHDNPQGQSGALNVLDGELVAMRQQLPPTGASADFMETIFSFIDKKMKELRGDAHA
jgi:hypothetical protein